MKITRTKESAARKIRSILSMISIVTKAVLATTEAVQHKSAQNVLATFQPVRTGKAEFS